jgi:hypothetical protein
MLIWIGGETDAVLRRTTGLADGWLSLGYPNDETRSNTTAPRPGLSGGSIKVRS